MRFVANSAGNGLLGILQSDYPIQDMIESPSRPWDRFLALREMYKRIGSEWIAYPIDWTKVFTPIEAAVWADMRCAGVRMWPQYPVGRYFLDFADPALRIAVECDGKDWHDEDRDMARDAELAALGWTVFRAPGAECARSITPDWEAYSDEDINEGTPEEVKRWLRSTSEGLVEAIAVHYYGGSLSHFTPSDVIESLKKHASRATPFVYSRFANPDN